MGHLRGSLDGGGRRGRCSRGSRSRGSRCGVLAVTTAGCGTEGEGKEDGEESPPPMRLLTHELFSFWFGFYSNHLASP